jgi:hypothetical protein
MVTTILLNFGLITKKIESYKIKEKKLTINITMDSGNTYSFEYTSETNFNTDVEYLEQTIRNQL